MKHLHLLVYSAIAIMLILMTIIVSLLGPYGRVLEKITTIPSIPKIIWTYFESNAPALYDDFLRTWITKNPDWKVRVLSDNNLRDHIPNIDLSTYVFLDTDTKRCDMIKSIVLNLYGGVWLDPKTIMHTTMNNILDIQQNDGSQCVAIYREQTGVSTSHPIIESFMFGCIQECSFMEKMLKVYETMNTYITLQDWALDVSSKENVVLPTITNDSSVFSLAAQYVMQKQLTTAEIQHMFSYFKAEDTCLKYLFDNQWSSYDGLLSLCQSSVEKPTTIFSSLGSAELKIIKENVDIRVCLLL